MEWDSSKPSLWAFVAWAAFNPLFWNSVARLEHVRLSFSDVIEWTFYTEVLVAHALLGRYRTGALTRYWGCGNRYQACYVLAALIFTLGLGRDYCFKWALEEQPRGFPPLPDTLAAWMDASWQRIVSQGLAAALATLGNLFVLGSMYRLGITGTYLGDYFGIRMDQRVTGFPFNLLPNPMYTGSTLIFLATAMWYESAIGLVLAAYVGLLYQVALLLEEPFTAAIYAAEGPIKAHRRTRSMSAGKSRKKRN